MDNNDLFAIDAILVEDAEMFKGREKSIEKAIKNLKKRLQTCVIFGERGIGKTSFAWQIISTLQNNNKRFRSIYTTNNLSDQNFYPIVIKDLRAPRNIDDLLIQCIAPSKKSFTLYEYLPSLYEDEKFLRYIKSTYQIDLTNIEDLLLLPDSRGNDDVIRRLFDDVLEKCKELAPNSKFIFFVDETDKMESRVGLGELIKNTSFAKFVFIGIADTVSELISDHESAGRKIVGGLIKLNPLSDKEVREIFGTARLRANNKVRFTKSLIDLTIKHSNGFPWIVQHIGDQAVSDINVDSLFEKKVSERVISEVVFHSVLPEVRHEYASAIYHTIDWLKLENNHTLRRVALAIIEAEKPLSVDEIHARMIGISFDLIDSSTNELVSIGILKSINDSKFRFIDPVIRSFSIETIERHGH